MGGKMKFKAVIFDLDGTLLDTLEDIADSVNQALRQFDFPTHDLETYRGFIGDGPKELVTRALPLEHRTAEMINACLKAYLENYQNTGEKHTRIYPGIPDLLDALVQRTIKLAILSNKRHDLALNCAKTFLSAWHFDVVLGLRNAIPRKPHPAGAVEISDRLNIPFRKIIYVGDSNTDMETALAADMFPVGVGWGFRAENELFNSGAKQVLKHPLQLMDLF